MPAWPELVGEIRFLRFLRGHGKDPVVAAEKYRTMLAWRKEMGTDAVREYIMSGPLEVTRKNSRGNQLTAVLMPPTRNREPPTTSASTNGPRSSGMRARAYEGTSSPSTGAHPFLLLPRQCPRTVKCALDATSALPLSGLSFSSSSQPTSPCPLSALGRASGRPTSSPRTFRRTNSINTGAAGPNSTAL